MATAMARQKDQRLAIQGAEQDLVRGHAEWATQRFPAPIDKPVDVINAAAADNTDHR